MASNSNFERLIQSLTPIVPCRPIPKNYVEALNRLWNPVGNPITEYFTLGDLWDSFEKWSACGAGTRVELYDTSEDVMQYFVPHLSAIQIFTNKSPTNLRLREDTTGAEDEFWSDESDFEKSSGSASNNSSNNWEVTSGDLSIDNDDSFPVKINLRNRYLEFHELCSPYYRVPLFDKILELAEEYPGLLSLRSTDLSPASWMAISWYPIYHIPPQEHTGDLSSAFLTFHTLSSFFQDNAEDKANENLSDIGSRLMSLPPFGVATYKLSGNIWFDHGDADYTKLYDLHSAADVWLKQLNFDHHDFKFFTMKADHVCKVDCACSSGAYYGSFLYK